MKKKLMTLVLAAAVVLTVVAIANAMGPGHGRGPFGFLQNLTDEQRQALREKVWTLRQQGATPEELRDAVKQYLTEQGIEVPENFGQFIGHGPFGGQRVDLSKVKFDVTNVENGVTVSITSDDPDTVAKIQERAAQGCKFMGGGHCGMRGGQQE